MAELLSTGLRDFLLHEGSVRKCFEDGVMNIYSGTAPSTADAAATGVLLCKVTVASGAVTTGQRSRGEHSNIQITSHAVGETFIINITIDGVGPTSYTYTNTPDAGDVNAVAVLVARMINDVPQMMAVAAGATVVAVDGLIFVKSRIEGLAHTIALDGASTGTAVVTDGALAAATLSTLQFLYAASGSMSKDADVWSGVVLVTGVAGYFRIVTNSDDGTLSTIQPRLQGSVGTSGAELNLSSTSLVISTTLTIDTFSVTLPASA